MRVFLAIDIPSEIKQELARILDKITSARKVPLENLHITLKFFGEVEDPAHIIETLREIKFEPFKVQLSRLGVFPHERNMRVLWVGTRDDRDLYALKRRIDDALSEWPEDHIFNGHITLARLAYPPDRKKVLELLEERPKGEFVVSELVLYKSTLTREGSVYEPLATFS